MEAPLEFRSEWIVKITEIFPDDAHDDDHDNFRSITAAILLVPTPLRTMKPEAFIPQLISLGPYHHSKLEIDIEPPNCVVGMVSKAERYKVRSAVTLRESGKNFDLIVKMIDRMRPEIERFYGLPTSTEANHSRNFARMMAIDSSFLLQYFCHFSRPSLTEDPHMKRFFDTYDACIWRDIMKLENQIPLRLLKDVLDHLIDKKSLSFNHMMSSMCHPFGPFAYDIRSFDVAENEPNISIDSLVEKDHHFSILINSLEKEPHFLGYYHTFLSQVLSMQPVRRLSMQPVGRQARIPKHKFSDIFNKSVKWIGGLLPAIPNTVLPAIPDTAVHFSKGMSAGQLAIAGIQFKCFTKLPDYIRLDKDSGTLYLPQICVNDTYTEVYLRNMLALEFNDDPRPKYVTYYVDLMGDLIQSPDDVRILLDGQVISGGINNLTNERIAQMWYDLRQPFFGASWTQIHGELHDAFEKWFRGSYWKNNIKRKFSKCYNFVLSWKFVAPLAGVLGLVMTGIQTFGHVHHCTH